VSSKKDVFVANRKFAAALSLACHAVNAVSGGSCAVHAGRHIQTIKCIEISTIDSKHLNFYI
jgi:hypothetical protein